MKRLALIHLALLASITTLACDKKADDDEFGSADESESNGSESNGSESGEASSTADSTEVDSTDAGEPVMCPDVFPSFDKTCEVVDDCVLALHTISCCGTNVAWGIAASELEAFDAAEAVCDGQYPECDCAPFPTMAEDGNSTENTNLLAVGCAMGSCTSFVLEPP